MHPTITSKAAVIVTGIVACAGTSDASAQDARDHRYYFDQKLPLALDVVPPSQEVGAVFPESRLLGAIRPFQLFDYLRQQKPCQG